MDDDSGFLRWFVPWKGTRPEDTPIGWYSIDDLAAAFTAGTDAVHERVIADVLGPERAEKLLRAFQASRKKD